MSQREMAFKMYSGCCCLVGHCHSKRNGRFVSSIAGETTMDEGASPFQQARNNTCNGSLINTTSPLLSFFLFFLNPFGCQEQIMCLLNIHLITVDEGPLLCWEVTFQMPFNKSSSLTFLSQTTHFGWRRGWGKNWIIFPEKGGHCGIKEEEKRWGRSLILIIF